MIKLSDVVTVDFETFFSTEYSLRAKKYNTSSYIRDELFEVMCVSIKEGRKPSKCYTGDAARAKLQSIDWSKKYLLAHNTAFDGAILAWHYGIVPKMYLDTLSMSRGLHAEYASKSLGEIGQLYGLGDKLEGGLALNEVKGKHFYELLPEQRQRLMNYCRRDNELCFEIFEKQLEVFPDDEMRLIDMTIRMFTQPVFMLNVPLCEEALDEATRERETGIALACHYGKCDEKDLTSNVRFVEVLKRLGVDAPTKKSKYNGEITYALSESDEEFVALLEHENPDVVRVVNGRLAAKSTINETRAARLLQAGCDKQAVPVGLNYYGAKTGRWSGANKLNFQNFPRESKLRRAIVAPKDHVIVVADSSQIEARMVNFIADNKPMLEVFASKGDPYSHTATAIYGFPVNKKDHPEERFVGKVATLGLGYGMGGRKFQSTLALGIMGPPIQKELNECELIVRKFRKANEPIVQYWAFMNGVLARIFKGERGEHGPISWDHDGIWLPNGMGILYPGLKLETDQDGNQTFKYFSKNVWKKLYGGLTTENATQALAGVVIRQQMLWVDDYFRSLSLRKNEIARIATMTHDEIVTVVPKRLAEKVQDKLFSIMRTPPEWCESLPLDCEGGFAENYSK